MGNLSDRTVAVRSWQTHLIQVGALSVLLLQWPGSALAPRTPLQAVDWLAVLAAEPGTRLDVDCLPAMGGRAPCLQVPRGLLLDEATMAPLP